MSQTARERRRFPLPLRWPHAGGDRSRRIHANQRADRPVDTLHATTAIPVARFQAPLHTLSRSPGASSAPTTITGVKIKSP
jgi:hypothetical protein